jgi:inorganic pyrophosphatase/exopolyphosphatase
VFKQEAYLKHFYIVVFRDSVDLKQLHMAGKLQLTLVDHHVLSPENGFLRTSVVEIIDHHPQDPAWLWSQQNVTLTTVGSCCTLVANEVVRRCPQLISHQVAALLYGECEVSGHFVGHHARAACVVSKVSVYISIDGFHMISIGGCHSAA